MERLRLPIGDSNFENIRNNGAYYVDKTRIIEDLANDDFNVILFTRPRRFGKTLMMRMLASFFDIGRDSAALFEGLDISRNTELCKRWMNRYPVLSLTLKDVDGASYEIAYGRYCALISEICKTNAYLATSDKKGDSDHRLFSRYMKKSASQSEMYDALFNLIEMLSIHYGKPAILLLDEYDVPLERAEQNGYFKEMLGLIRGLFSKAIKDNPFLKFAVITGCLRIAHESIFSDANNFMCNTVSDTRYAEYFGFTQTEVAAMLKAAGFEDKLPDLKAWYDGYLFGKTEIYCPWDVINCVRDLYDAPDAPLKSYWKNTSSNSIIRRLLKGANQSVRQKLETLVNGGSITTEITEDLSYDIVGKNEKNVWSIMYLTGYLTLAQEQPPQSTGALNLVIPNSEVKSIYSETVMNWLETDIRAGNNSDIFDAASEGDAEHLTARIEKLLRSTVSYYDYREDYYHAFLTGIFAGIGCYTESNREYGDGRPDIVIHDDMNSRVIIIEIKRAKTKAELPEKAVEALRQIAEKHYAAPFEDDYDSIVCYGAAFCKKRCLFTLLR